MAEISAAMIKDLRDRTGAGPMDCKKALGECGGDLEKATEYLRKKGLAAQSKLGGRIAAEGAVASYIHGGGRLGVLVEANSETDFVARSEDFQTFLKEISMQIAAMNPRYLSSEDVPKDLVEKERAILLAKAKESGKPEAVIGKMVDGQIGKWMKEICLLDQPWVKDDKKTVANLLQELVAKVRENCKVRRFVRFEVGEGIEKRKDDFAAEVAKQAGG